MDAVLDNIQAWKSNTEISECLGVNLKTVQRIRKELGVPMGNYEDMGAWKHHWLYW